MLAQKQEDGTIRPIAYASRTLQQHERNYGATELEALGVVWAVRHFRHYLYGHHCDVYTDHEALKALLNTPHPSGKLARWGLSLQEVDLSIFYRPGKKNMLADALSRSPVEQEPSTPLVPEENLVATIVGPEGAAKSGERSLAIRQFSDPQLKPIMAYLASDDLPVNEKEARELVLSKHQYLLLGGILHYVMKDKTLRIIPPTEDRKSLFKEVHAGAFSGHLRDSKMHGELERRYWWPGMRGDIRCWCQACLVCASRSVGRSVRPPLTPIPVAGSFDRVGVDVLHFTKSTRGNQYVVVFLDYLTKWPEAFATQDQSALTIAKLFVEEVVSRHGVPAQLLSDRGKAFLSTLMQEVCQVLGVKKINTTAYHPQTDGLVERFNRTLTSMLAKRVQRNGEDWDQHLPYVLFAYRASLQESTRESPFYLLYGRDARLPSALDIQAATHREETNLDSYKGELVEGLSQAWADARKNVEKAQKAQKTAYDTKAKEPNFRIGERVFVYMPQEKACKAYKFARPFHGPYRVAEVLDTGLLVRPVGHPEQESIRVAVNRVRRCPAAIAEEEFWPEKKKTPRKTATKRQEKQNVQEEPLEEKQASKKKTPKERPKSSWSGRLREPKVI